MAKANNPNVKPCSTPKCKNTVPRPEWPADPYFGIFCTDCLRAATGLPSFGPSAELEDSEDEKPAPRTVGGRRAQAVVDAIEGKRSWAEARAMASDAAARLLDHD